VVFGCAGGLPASRSPVPVVRRQFLKVSAVVSHVLGHDTEQIVQRFQNGAACMIEEDSLKDRKDLRIVRAKLFRSATFGILEFALRDLSFFNSICSSGFERIPVRRAGEGSEVDSSGSVSPSFRL
jgi:hypothetical protein